MMQNDFANAVPDVPAGLVACRLNGCQLHISFISENALWLRPASGAESRGTLEVCFRQPDGGWNSVSIHDYKTEPAHSESCGALVRFSFSDAEFAARLRRSMAFYGDYIRAFAEDDVQSMIAYPAHPDGAFGGEFDLSFLRIPADREICISLHDPDLVALYLGHPKQDFLKIYASQKHIPEITDFHRLYIGNGFCRRLFPDEETLAKLLARAGEEGTAVTLVTAPDPRLSDAFLASWRGEMLVNDWGLLHRLRAFPQIEPVFGTLLNKRCKDPRMHYKPDLRPDLLRESSINSPEYRAYLQSFGIKRFEFERCGYDFDVPAGKCSLHLPFYQTNTSVYCPTRALCEHGERGHQSGDAGCPHYCLRNGLQYPSHLKMLSRFNSLFALDDRPLDALPGFDRIVLAL